MKSKILCAGLALVLSMLTSCVLVDKYSHVNEPLAACQNIYSEAGRNKDIPSASYLASSHVQFDLDWRCRNQWSGSPPERSIDQCLKVPSRRDRNFISLSLSGGGSRAAVFAAAVMFELQRYSLLQQVDVISSTSGGSITAALYAMSCDQEDDCPETITGTKRYLWTQGVIFPLLERDFILRWVGNWFYPSNVPKTLFTYYDKSDIMAQTLSNNLYGSTRFIDETLRFRDLNPRRPYLLINATNWTDSLIQSYKKAESFSFTVENFQRIGSCLDLYPISYAVAASIAIPGEYPVSTLRNYSESSPPQFIHLLDAGVIDNHALMPIQSILENQYQNKDLNVLIIIVDSNAPVWGRSADYPIRSIDKYIIDDLTIMAAFRIMSNSNSAAQLADIKRTIEDKHFKSIKIMHLNLFDVSDQNYIDVLLSSPSSKLSMNDEEADILRRAAQSIVKRTINDLQKDAYWKDIIQIDASEK